MDISTHREIHANTQYTTHICRETEVHTVHIKTTELQIFREFDTHSYAHTYILSSETHNTEPQRQSDTDIQIHATRDTHDTHADRCKDKHTIPTEL